MEIPQLQFNNVIISAGTYTQSEIMAKIGATFVEKDNYKYIQFKETPQDTTTLSNCYYFHNLKIGSDSCLDAIYEEVTADTQFDLVNYTKSIDTTTTVNAQYGVSNANGKFYFPFAFTANFTGTMKNYFTNFANAMTYRSLAPKLSIYNNQYYLSPNTYYWALTTPTSENDLTYYPVTSENILNIDKIYRISRDNTPPPASMNPVREILPSSYYSQGIPLKFMDQFSQSTHITIPAGIYTFSQFKDILATVQLPEGYTFDADTMTISTSCAPEYTFAISTPLFNIPQTYGISLQITDPLQKIYQAVFIKDNQHIYHTLKDDNIVIMKNGNPANIQLVDGINVIQSNKKCIQLLQSEELPFSIFSLGPNIDIPNNPVYKSVKLQGYLTNIDLISSSEKIAKNILTINNEDFHVTIPQNITRKFTQPLTISGGNNVLMVCRVSYVDPV